MSLNRKLQKKAINPSPENFQLTPPKDSEVKKSTVLFSYFQKDLIPAAWSDPRIVPAPTAVDDAGFELMKEVISRIQGDKESFDTTIKDTKKRLEVYEKDMEEYYTRFSSITKDLIQELDANSKILYHKPLVEDDFLLDQFKLTLINKLTGSYLQFIGDIQRARSNLNMEITNFQDSFKLLDFNWKNNKRTITANFNQEWSTSAKSFYNINIFRVNQWMLILKSSVVSLMDQDLMQTTRQIEDGLQRITKIKSETYTRILDYKMEATKSIGTMLTDPKTTAVLLPTPTPKAKAKSTFVETGKTHSI